jgi:D-alanine-D-alanine ligase
VEKMKKKIGVFFGGKSVEHEVSVITGHQVMENIDHELYDVVPVFIDKDGKWYTGDSLKDFNNFKNRKLENLIEVTMNPVYGDYNLYTHHNKMKRIGKNYSERLDVIFPAMHGTNGEDGSLMGLFELIGIPYVGCGVMASAVGMDKIVMKSVFKAENLPIVNYAWFYRQRWEQDSEKIIADIETNIGYPVVVKPANLGSSIGISKASNREELLESIKVAICYDRKIIVEEAVQNLREINCAVMGYEDQVKASLCEEPIGWEEIQTFADKYMSGSKGTKAGTKDGGADNHQIPANLPGDMSSEIQRLAKEAFIALDCAGNARIDFMIGDNKDIYVNEINTLPGSLSFHIWKASGLEFKPMLTEMVEMAIKISSEKHGNMYTYDVDLYNNMGKKSTTK